MHTSATNDNASDADADVVEHFECTFNAPFPCSAAFCYG